MRDVVVRAIEVAVLALLRLHASGVELDHVRDAVAVRVDLFRGHGSGVAEDEPLVHAPVAVRILLLARAHAVSEEGHDLATPVAVLVALLPDALLAGRVIEHASLRVPVAIRVQLDHVPFSVPGT